MSVIRAEMSLNRQRNILSWLCNDSIFSFLGLTSDYGTPRLYLCVYLRELNRMSVSLNCLKKCLFSAIKKRKERKWNNAPCADSCLILTLTGRPLSMWKYCHQVFIVRNSNQWDQTAGAPVLYIVGKKSRGNQHEGSQRAETNTIDC